ncbi:uncharacterized protein TNIN_377191 [Trichonephila inaurata madagascariensis]|uniref:Uncharacterized protein n=1 Tax=Trichonephila inaurata madagascariensis TaxID=2747483 RepID=A0A8X7CBR8_9ARAC|nr:uncharacterized protein TNIN_377191 [Trichonephila inaurata madagascariensis]
MALQQREICKVGESPSARRRSLSPRRGSGPSSNEENPDQPVIEPSPEIPKASKLSSPSSSAPEALDPKQNKSPKHAAWKSSKFFSRSMASGELLKGFKKLSTATPVTSIVVSEEDGNPTVPSTEIKESEAKTFKSRFSSLRRKSGSDSDTVPSVDSESLKHGSPEVRGIVCKKEDLLHLMTKVPGTKERRVSSPAELIVPVASSLPTSPIPVLKSPSLKVAPNSPLTRGSFRSSRSASLDPTTLPNMERPVFKLPNKPAIRTSVYQPPLQPARQGSKKTTDDICIKKTGAFLEVVPEVKRRLSGPLIEVKDKIVEENEEAEGDGSETPVQWDDSNFVDPNLLGGAIEAFLKGMGSSPTPTPTTEKRVSFKKNLIK